MACPRNFPHDDLNYSEEFKKINDDHNYTFLIDFGQILGNLYGFKWRKTRYFDKIKTYTSRQNWQET